MTSLSWCGKNPAMKNLNEILEELDYRRMLKGEFDHRRRNNPAYSLRSYARDLYLSPSRLSEVLNGKGDLSPSTLLDVGAKLGIPKNEVLALQAAHVFRTAAENSAIHISAKGYLESYQYQRKFSQLTDETYKILSDWYHFAILSAMELEMYDGTVDFLARVLKLEVNIVQEALERMEKQNMVAVNDGAYCATGEIFTTSNDVSSDALKVSHRQNFELAGKSLDEVDVLLRDITSATICIDIDRLPEAKKMIKEFRRNMCHFLEAGKKHAVFNFNIQLHPISEVIYEKK